MINHRFKIIYTVRHALHICYYMHFAEPLLLNTCLYMYTGSQLKSSNTNLAIILKYLCNLRTVV